MVQPPVSGTISKIVDIIETGSNWVFADIGNGGRTVVSRFNVAVSSHGACYRSEYRMLLVN